MREVDVDGRATGAVFASRRGRTDGWHVRGLAVPRTRRNSNVVRAVGTILVMVFATIALGESAGVAGEGPGPAPTVTFDANGGSGSMSPQTSNEPASLSANAFTRAGYAFKGWNTRADGSGTGYSDQSTFEFATDETLYAQWRQSQTISFGPLANRKVVKSPFVVTAVASSGLQVTFTAAPSSVCGRNGATVTLRGPGICAITAHQAGDAVYDRAPTVTQMFSVSKANQKLSFRPLANRKVVESPFVVSATASSGLPVAFTAAPSPVCTMKGATVTLGAAGKCTVTALQAGNNLYNAAPAVARSFRVSKANQTISFGPLADRKVVKSPFVVSATASSGLPVAFTATPSSVCTVRGSTVTLRGPGTCVIEARQAGSVGYRPARAVRRSFVAS